MDIEDLKDLTDHDIDCMTLEDVEDLVAQSKEQNKLLQVLLKHATLIDKCQEYEMKIYNLENKIETLKLKNTNYARKLENLIYNT